MYADWITATDMMRHTLPRSGCWHAFVLCLARRPSAVVGSWGSGCAALLWPLLASRRPFDTAVGSAVLCCELGCVAFRGVLRPASCVCVGCRGRPRVPAGFWLPLCCLSASSHTLAWFDARAVSSWLLAPVHVACMCAGVGY
jgi:hypothetical protein